MDGILHAGDVSSWQVIETLEKIAPVTVVQGNRDWFFGMKLPRSATLHANGIEITLAHGHRTMFHYMVDKWAYFTHGYLFKRYYDHLAVDFPTADVIIFGHTHHQTSLWVENRLFFNPGASYPCPHTTSRRNSASSRSCRMAPFRQNAVDWKNKKTLLINFSVTHP